MKKQKSKGLYQNHLAKIKKLAGINNAELWFAFGLFLGILLMQVVFIFLVDHCKL